MTSVSPRHTLPATGRASPAHAERSTDWPDPSIPASPITSPARASKLTSRDLQPQRFQGNTAQGQDRLAGLQRGLARERNVPLEHHSNEGLCLVRGLRRSDERSLAEHRDAGAQELDVFQLVGHEDDRHALGGKPLQRGEQLFLLRLADAGGRLVEDQHARAEPQEAQDFQLLPFAHGQGVHECLGVQGEVELLGKRPELSRRLPPVGKDAPGSSEDEIVQDPQGREIQGILVEHADALPDGVRRRVDDDTFPVQEDLAAVRQDEAGQDLHERALPGAVLTQDALDRRGGDVQGYPRIRLD